MTIFNGKKLVEDAKAHEVRIYSVCSVYKDKREKEICERSFYEGFAFAKEKLSPIKKEAQKILGNFTVYEATNLLVKLIGI